MQSDHKGIRREAAISCVKMISTSSYPSSERGASVSAIEEIVGRLVEMIVADPDCEVSSISDGYGNFRMFPYCSIRVLII